MTNTNNTENTEALAGANTNCLEAGYSSNNMGDGPSSRIDNQVQLSWAGNRQYQRLLKREPNPFEVTASRAEELVQTNRKAAFSVRVRLDQMTRSYTHPDGACSLNAAFAGIDAAKGLVRDPNFYGVRGTEEGRLESMQRIQQVVSFLQSREGRDFLTQNTLTDTDTTRRLLSISPYFSQQRLVPRENWLSQHDVEIILSVMGYVGQYVILTRVGNSLMADVSLPSKSFSADEVTSLLTSPRIIVVQTPDHFTFCGFTALFQGDPDVLRETVIRQGTKMLMEAIEQDQQVGLAARMSTQKGQEQRGNTCDPQAVPRPADTITFSDSEGELDDEDTDRALKQRWDHSGLEDKAVRAQCAEDPSGLTNQGEQEQEPSTSWKFGMSIASGASAPQSVTGTDSRTIQEMRAARVHGMNEVPPINSRENRIAQFRNQGRSKEGPPTGRPDDRTKGLSTVRACAGGTTLLVPSGVIKDRRRVSQDDPLGRRYLKLGTGQYMLVNQRYWDALLIPDKAPMRLADAGDKYRNLMPYLRYTHKAGQGNCRWSCTPNGFPVLVAKYALGQDTQLWAEDSEWEQPQLMGEDRDSRPEEWHDSEKASDTAAGAEGASATREAVEEVEELEDEEVKGNEGTSKTEEKQSKAVRAKAAVKKGSTLQGVQRKAIPKKTRKPKEAEHDPSGGEIPVQEEFIPPPKKQAWSARSRKVKSWTDELNIKLAESNMWCYIQKRGNLHLCTINVNGMPMRLELQQEILQMVNGKDCPIDGIILIDTRTSEAQLGFQTRAWQKVFEGKELYIRVLAGKALEDIPSHLVRACNLVGGSTLLFFPRPGLRVREVTYDPAKLGILTCVTIGIGPTDSILWLGVYVPFQGKEDSGGLERKLKEWYKKYRLPQLKQGEEKDAAAKFDTSNWIWDFLVADKIGRSALNRNHVGVILTGDLNQIYDQGDETTQSLCVRTEALGLYTSLIERFQHVESEYHTHGMVGNNGGRHIDHVFSSLPDTALTAGGSPQGAQWIGLSDHLPMCASFYLKQLHGSEQGGRRQVYKGKPNAGFKFTDKADRETKKMLLAEKWAAFKIVTQIHPAAGDRSVEADSNMLEYLSREVPAMVETMMKTPRKITGKAKATGSTLIQSARLHLRMLVQLYRVWGGTPNRKRWRCKTKRDRLRCTDRIFTSWEKAEHKMWAKSSEIRPTALEWGTGNTREWWACQFIDEDFFHNLGTDIAITQTAVRNQEKRETNKEIKAIFKRNDELAVAGKMRSVTQSILGTRKRSSLIDVVEGPDGPITDPEEIHVHLTKEWEKKFDHPPGSLPYLLGLEGGDGTGDQLTATEIWEGFLDDPEKMVDMYDDNPNVNVPRELIEIIAKAFAGTKERGTAEEEISQAMAKPFGVAEMRRVISKHGNTAPGLTGLTYQMLNLLPDDATEDFFKLMERLWQEKHVPEFWKLKGLIGLPKVDIVKGVNDLRPIGLIEVTRKIWTSMVTRRMLGVIKSRLQNNHCGGLANKGTDTALLQLINLLEDAQEFNEAADYEVTDVPLDFMSWDTAKAFDSVGNHIQYASWRRMGVPAQVAMWLMQLDLGGAFVLLSPHTKKTLDSIRMAGKSDTGHHETIRKIGFTPARGFTQGDVKSPIAWICFFDTLVAALNQCRADAYPKARTEASVSHPVRPMVFIDDLTTATCYREHTQEIADIVSAFNAMFGTVCAVAKFRAVSTHSQDKEELIIRSWDWKPTTVPFQDGAACVRTLGINVNLDCSWKEQIRDVSHNLARVANVIRAKTAKPFTKVACINMSVIQGILYKATGSVWSAKDIDDLDHRITQMTRRALGLPRSYPYDLIHAQTGGLGIKSLTQLHLEASERTITRCLAGPEPGASAARGLANRLFRTKDKEDAGLGGETAVARHTPGNTYMSALLKHATRLKEKWHRKGDDSGYLESHIGVKMKEMSMNTYEWLRGRDIQYISELTDCTENRSGERKLLPWIRAPQGVLPDLEKLVQEANRGLIRNRPLTITRGHLILLKGGQFGEGTFFSVDGFISLNNPCMLAGLSYKQAEGQGEKWERKRRLFPNESEYPGMTISPVEPFLTREVSVRTSRCSLELLLRHAVGLAISTGADEYGDLTLVGVNETVVFDKKPPARHRLHESTTPAWCKRVVEWVKEGNRPIHLLTTDGSSKEQNTTLGDQWSSMESKKSAQGAIMMFDQEIHQQRSALGPPGVVVITDFPPELGAKSNVVELLTLAAAHQIGHEIKTIKCIESDAQSILKHAEKEARSKASRSRDVQNLGVFYRSIRRIGYQNKHMRRKHSKAHPEEGGRSPATFTGKEARMFAADVYADPGTALEAEAQASKARDNGLKYNIVPEGILYIKAEEVIEGLFEKGEFFWKKEDGPIRVQNSRQLTGHIISEYLIKRTEESKKHSNYPWHRSEMGFLATKWGKKKAMPCSKREAQQHIFDKKAHGRNIKKGKPSFDSLCPLCQRNDEDQAHLLLRCEHPVMTYWRKDYFETCRTEINKSTEARPKAFMHELWNWIGKSLDEGDPDIINQDSRRVALMMGRPLKEDVTLPEFANTISSGEQKAIQALILITWKLSIEYAKLTWCTRGFLRSTPEKIAEWYNKGDITADMVKGIFDHQYRALAEPKVWAPRYTKIHEFNEFNILSERAPTKEPVREKKERVSNRKISDSGNKNKKRKRKEKEPTEEEGSEELSTKKKSRKDNKSHIQINQYFTGIQNPQVSKLNRGLPPEGDG